MNIYKNLKYGLLILLVSLCKTTREQSANKPKLHFKLNSTFRILHMTDQHFENDLSIDQKNINATQYILEQTQPDLVLVTGDIVSGYMWDGSSVFFPKLHELFTRPFRANDVPYAITIGNHDDEADYDRSQILNLESSINQSYTMSNQFHTLGSNYYIPIYDPTSKEEILRLWAFDTQNTGCGGHSGSFGCIDDSVLESFRKEQSNTPYGLVFLHIPPVEFIDLYNNFPTFGSAQENISCSLSSPNLVETLIKQQNIQWLIAGHDHQNDFGGIYKNKYGSLEMMYGRKSGYGGYPGKNEPGARILDFTYTGSVIEVNHYILDYNGQITHDEEIIQDKKLTDWCVLSKGNGWDSYIWMLMLIGFQTCILLVTLILLFKKYSSQFNQIEVEYVLQHVDRDHLPFKNFMEIEFAQHYEEER